MAAQRRPRTPLCTGRFRVSRACAALPQHSPCRNCRLSPSRMALVTSDHRSSGRCRVSCLAAFDCEHSPPSKHRLSLSRMALIASGPRSSDRCRTSCRAATASTASRPTSSLAGWSSSRSLARYRPPPCQLSAVCCTSMETEWPSVVPTTPPPLSHSLARYHPAALPSLSLPTPAACHLSSSRSLARYASPSLSCPVQTRCPPPPTLVSLPAAAV